jgi:hypothetical protein
MLRAMHMEMVMVSHIMFPDSFLRSGFLSGARRHQRLPRQQTQALQQQSHQQWQGHHHQQKQPLQLQSQALQQQRQQQRQHPLERPA